jgi:hypothetical protein
MAERAEIIIATEAGALTLTPTTIPNPGGMLDEVDGVAVKWPSGRRELLPLMPAYARFRDAMNDLQVARLMGWELCSSCQERSAHGSSSGKCVSCAPPPCLRPSS